MSQSEFPINLEMNSGWSMITETENQQSDWYSCDHTLVLYSVQGCNLQHLLWLNMLDGYLLLRVNFVEDLLQFTHRVMSL